MGTTPTPAPARHTRRQANTVIVVAMFWFVVATYVLHSVVPGPVVVLPGPGQDAVKSVVPQGWAFFTKDPRDDRFSVLRESSDGWETVPVGPNGDPRYVFGLHRYPRVQSVELHLLAETVPAEAWVSCAGSWARCADALDASAPVRNAVAAPSLCGRLTIVRSEPTPWAWAHSVDPEQMPSTAARLDVSC